MGFLLLWIAVLGVGILRLSVVEVLWGFSGGA